MSFTFTVDTSISLVFVHGDGVLALDDLHMLSQALAVAGVYSLPRLVDLHNATVHLFQYELQELIDFLATHRAQYGSVRIAAIVGDMATYGLFSLYQSMKDDPGFGVFRALPEAMDWLRQETI